MANNIKDVACLLAEHFIDFEEDGLCHLENKKLISDNADRLGDYYRYLGSLHDSWIINIKTSDKEFDVELNDFTTHVFANALIIKKNLKIDHSKLFSRYVYSLS